MPNSHEAGRVRPAPVDAQAARTLGTPPVDVDTASPGRNVATNPISPDRTPVQRGDPSKVVLPQMPGMVPAVPEGRVAVNAASGIQSIAVSVEIPKEDLPVKGHHSQQVSKSTAADQPAAPVKEKKIALEVKIKKGDRTPVDQVNIPDQSRQEPSLTKGVVVFDEEAKPAEKSAATVGNSGKDGGKSELPPTANEDSDLPRTYAEATSFMRPWDGNQPEVAQAEKTQVADRFTTVVDNLLDGESGVEVSHSADGSKSWAYVDMPLERGDFIRFEVISDEGNITSSRFIDVVHLEENPDGYPQQFTTLDRTSYRFNEHGEVIRFDITNGAAGSISIPEILAGMPTESIEDLNETLGPKLETVLSYAQFASQAGLNAGTIDNDEMRGLVSLLRKAVTLSSGDGSILNVEGVEESEEQSQKGESETITFNWAYLEKDTHTKDELLTDLMQTLREKDVLSVGEHHDENQDQSFSWINEHTGEILEAYERYRDYAKYSGSDVPPKIQQILPQDSQLLERLLEQDITIDDLLNMHVGRFFAFNIIPVAARLGYTDLVLEGFDEQDPWRTIQRSKDKTGHLLRMTMAMITGMRLHGDIPDSRFPTPTDMRNTIFSKTKEVKEAHPDAKILVYNGALHNMTEPFPDGTIVNLGILGEEDAHDWSYAPEANSLWGNRYGAIDLINGNRELVESHFKYMQTDAEAGTITRYIHGVDQKTYIFK